MLLSMWKSFPTKISDCNSQGLLFYISTVSWNSKSDWKMLVWLVVEVRSSGRHRQLFYVLNKVLELKKTLHWCHKQATRHLLSLSFRVWQSCYRTKFQWERRSQGLWPFSFMCEIFILFFAFEEILKALGGRKILKELQKTLSISLVVLQGGISKVPGFYFHWIILSREQAQTVHNSTYAKCDLQVTPQS